MTALALASAPADPICEAMLPATPISGTAVDRFHEEGFCVAPQLLSSEQSMTYRSAALRYANHPSRLHASTNGVFTQLVNVWLDDPELRTLTFHPQVQAAVRSLARGRRMRLWHDHLLIKRPHNGLASEFHQDEPYWSVARETFTISAWIALGDAPTERGCMSFIPGTQRRRDLRSQDLNSAGDLFSIWPDLVYEPRVVCPVRSGGCTFHQGFTAHRAGPNQTDVDRVAMSIIWVEEGALFTGSGHPVTDDLGLTPGMTLPDHRCPLVPVS